MQIAPKEERFEKTADFELRKAQAESAAQKLAIEWKDKQNDIRAPLLAKENVVLNPLKNQLQDISAREYFVESTDVQWSLADYDADAETLSLNMNGPLLAGLKEQCKSLFEPPEVVIKSCQVALSVPAPNAKKYFSDARLLAYFSKFRKDGKIYVTDGFFQDADKRKYFLWLRVRASVPIKVFIDSVARVAGSGLWGGINSVDRLRANCEAIGAKEAAKSFAIPPGHRIVHVEGKIEIDIGSAYPVATDACYFQGTIEIAPGK